MPRRAKGYWSHPGPARVPPVPTQLLERMADRHVLLVLKDQRRLAGRLLGSDDFMNVVLDETHETRPESDRRLGRVVVRGSNVVSVHLLDATGTARA
jgi:small nuclear ribonucleoprotein (snRNP)-like protein